MAQGPMLGHKVRRLRRDRDVSQVALAGQLGISPSYLNLIEHNQRQLTLPLLLKVSRLFEVDLEAFSDEDETRLLGDLIEAFGDPMFRESGIERDDLTDLVNASPAACRAIVDLYRAYRTANDNVRGMSDRLSDDAFISSSIHELLTLLTSIRSFSEILHDHADMGAEERQKFLGIIVSESERLTDAVGQLAEIARGAGAVSVRASESEDERLLFWAGRKAAFPAVGRISPDYYCMDGTIPRGKLPIVLGRMRELSEQFGLRVANVFHAGDGNLHPLILYDANKPGELEAAEQLGAEILKLCVEVGGVLTGEHGVGVEKRDLMPTMFSETDLQQQQRVKCAFDPDALLNPGKMFPELHRCAELGRLHVHRGQLPFPDLPRF